MVALASPLDAVRAGDDWTWLSEWYDSDGVTPAGLSGYTFAATVTWQGGNISLPAPVVDLEAATVTVRVSPDISVQVPARKDVSILLEYTDPLGIVDSIIQPFAAVLERGR
jgi:hypothetical protein